MQEFQKFLDLILNLDGIQTESSISTFFDFTNRGISGACRDLGSQNILIETMAFAKPCISMIEVYVSCFLVLSKEGTIFVFETMYDGINDPVVAYSIDNDVHIATRPGSTKIDLKRRSNNQRLIIKLSTEAQHANWLRTISDFSTKEVSSFVKVAQPVTEISPSRAVQAPPQVHVRSAGTGNTEDELSALYGI